MQESTNDPQKMRSKVDGLRLPDELVTQLEQIEARVGQSALIALVYGAGYDEGFAGKVRWPRKSDRASWRPKNLSVAYGLGVDAGKHDPRLQATDAAERAILPSEWVARRKSADGA